MEVGAKLKVDTGQLIDLALKQMRREVESGNFEGQGGWIFERFIDDKGCGGQGEVEIRMIRSGNIIIKKNKYILPKVEGG